MSSQKLLLVHELATAMREARETVGISHEQLNNRLNRSRAWAYKTELPRDKCVGTLLEFMHGIGGELHLSITINDRRYDVWPPWEE